MESRAHQGRWYWPTTGRLADAERAADQGFWAALACAGVIALIATVSVFAQASVIGIDPFAYVDALLFAIIAWRIRRRSRAFAVIGLVLFILEKIYQFATQPMAYSGAIVAIALLVAFANGIRGTFAYHRILAESAPALD